MPFDTGSVARTLPVAALTAAAAGMAWLANGSTSGPDWLPYALLGALLPVSQLVVDTLALGLLDLLQLLADAFERVVEVRVLQLLLAPLAQLLQQILQTRHALPILVLGPLTQESLECAP